ncbi:MAG: arylsulfatase [Verrucomicrobiota bacterium]
MRPLVTALIFSVALPVAAADHQPESAGAAHPNILLILADDFGWGDASCNNPDAAFETKNIDRIAAEGARFTNAHTPHAVCTPTRYSLLTGRYCWRTELREGVLPGYGKSLIRPNRLTLASLLKKHDYRTGVFGKWHLGLDWVPVEGDPGDWHWGTQVWMNAKPAIALIGDRIDHSKPPTVGPKQLGFDRAFITPSNNTRVPVFFRDDRVDGSPAKDNEGTMRDPRVQRDTVDDFHVKEAIAFLEEWQTDHADNPFFLYLPLNAIHAATNTPKRFKGKTKDGLRGDKALWLDESIGKIFAALERLNTLDDTLIIFTSDNGPIPPTRYNPDSPHRAAGPYRGYKSDALDGGCRVPFLVRWPGHVKPGTVSDNLLSLSDVIATFAALVDEPLPEWAGEDSVNQLPVLLGQTDTPVRSHLITQSNAGAMAIRSADWKLILGTEGAGGIKTPDAQPIVITQPWAFEPTPAAQLYNLKDDPYEQNDLYDSHPEQAKKLHNLLKEQIWSGRSR